MFVRTAAILMFVALLAAGCQPSQIDSEAEVTISGKLLRQDGSPARIEEIVLAPGFSGLGELLGGTFFTLLSAGLVCLADSPPEPCEVFRRRVQTEQVRSDGGFSLRAKGSDTQTFFGNARPMSLSARLPEGQVVLALFRVQTEQLELPGLRFWEPEVRAGKTTVVGKTFRTLATERGAAIESCSRTGRAVRSGSLSPAEHSCSTIPGSSRTPRAA